MRTLAITWGLLFLYAISARALPEPAQRFAKPEDYRLEPLRGKAAPEAFDEDKRGPTGFISLRVSAPCPVDNSGARLSWSFPPSVMDGQTFGLYVRTMGEPLNYLTVRFLGVDGKSVCRHTYFGVASENAWQRLTFVVGGKGRADYFEAQNGSKDEKDFEPGQLIAGIALELGGAAGKRVQVQVSDFSAETAAVTQRGPALPASAPTLTAGDNALWLDAQRQYALAGIKFLGRVCVPSPASAYPSLQVVDAEGKTLTWAAGEPGWSVSLGERNAGSMAVLYSRDGTTISLTWSVSADAIRCESAVVAEGRLKAASVGAEQIIGLALDKDDYAIAPDGTLMRPAPGADAKFSWWGQGDNVIPNFVAVRSGDRIVYYKPESFAQRMFIRADETDKGPMAWMGGALYFRPQGFKNPATKLAHSQLAWKIESAGDVNRDGAVDWVDCGLAYRDRYIKPNRDKSAWLRDSYRLYHQVMEPYTELAATIERLDFATGCWWVKGAMVCGIETPSEGHPYAVEAFPARGDKSAVADRIRATGSRVGIYYGGDYIMGAEAGWPPELIKLDAAGGPHRYSQFRAADETRPMYYKDNVRGLAAGLLKTHYERIIAAVWLKPGDPVMLDTFTAFARPGYNPDFPATAQNETEAKHEIARWLKYDKGLCVAGEAIIEGTQDVVDYGGICYHSAYRKEFWKSGFPKKIVPLLTVVYHGSTLMGDSWYELRNPNPNWAASLAFCGGLWDWSSEIYPKYIYEKVARTFFNQNIFWSRVADHRLVDIDQQGTAYMLRFENGSVLYADPEKRTWWLEEGGVRYDGFTPFNNRGVMAILKQGPFDIVLPVRDMLEIIPSQPHREQLDVVISQEADGRIRVRGDFSKVPWTLPTLRNVDGKKVRGTTDAAPVLMLRKKGAVQ